MDHLSMGSNDRWRLFWTVQTSSSWSRGTMEETPSKSSIMAWMGTAARTTRPRNR